MAEDLAATNSPAVLSKDIEQLDGPRVTKRRQSPGPDPTTKRTKISRERELGPTATACTSVDVSPSETNPSIVPQNDSNKDRQKSSVQEERKRGRRLFGGLLNTLSQSTSNTQQKKRLEVEKRQQEKARLQKAEDESRRAERLQKLKGVRSREQVKFDEQSMRIRHSNVLAMAQFLRTKSEPKLLYKPWQLLPGDAERIKGQIADAESLIEREVQDFRERYRADLQLDERPVDKTNDSAEETVGEHHTESSPVPLVAEFDSTNPYPPLQGPESGNVHVAAERDPQEENGEVVVEGDEDTVIY